MDLASIVELASAEARNDGTQTLQTSKDPFDAQVLRAVTVSPPQRAQFDLGNFLDAGVVHQYAEAEKNGAAMGSSGAVGDDGAIGVGKVGTGSAGDLTLDLNKLLDTKFAAILTNLKLALKAVSAQAVGKSSVASGNYTLAGATLTFTSPAVGGLTGKVDGALSDLDAQLVGLGGPNGSLGVALKRVLDPVLGVTGSSANVSASVTTDAHSAVQSLLTGDYGNGAVHVNLQTGEVSVDLATLLGGDLNKLPVNTELLSADVIDKALKGVTDTVSTLSDQIIDKVRLSLVNAQVSVHADLDLLTAQAPTTTSACHDIQVPVYGLLGALTGYTTQSVCTLVAAAVPALRSTVKVAIEGTVDQIVHGTTAKADAAISLLGGAVTPVLNVNGIVAGLGTSLTDGLFGSTGALSRVTGSLTSRLVAPAVTGLLGSDGVGSVLTDILSIRVNLQELSPASLWGMGTGQIFTQTAVRVTALKAPGSSSLATVNVAAASVGPNVTKVNTTSTPAGCTTNCDLTTNADPCVLNCTNGVPLSAGAMAARLAMTGVGIATLIAILLALLAAGAYLAREGYRRTHSGSVTPEE